MEYLYDIIHRAEFETLNGIQQFWICKPLNYLFSAITPTGVVTFLWITVGLMMAFSKKYRRTGIIMLFALSMGTILGTKIIKPIVCRIRPFAQIGFSTYITPPHGFSFPSGHTLSSTISAFCVYKADRRAGLFAIVCATLIAFSRMYFYVHFPSDILAGFFIGCIISKILLKYDNANHI